LGREIAKQFVREGASVALCARDGALLEKTGMELAATAGPGQTIRWQACDISSEKDVSRFVAFGLREFRAFQILVSNAGVLGPKGPTETVDLKAWKEAIEINLFGAILLTQQVVPHFKKSGYGKFIAVSGGGATAPFPFMSAYAASKAGLVRLVETLAVELRPYSIDVNAVAPGAMNTRMTDETIAAGPEKVGASHYERAVKQKKEGGISPEQPAKLCTFLSSAESDGITGRLISAQWDSWGSLPSHREELTASDIYTLRRIVPEDRGKTWS
jgi:NAD(P)-dependent dehydrogenase (short-subunit alcohol dehydrogenase family)